MATGVINQEKMIALTIFCIAAIACNVAGQQLHMKHAPPYVVLQSQVDEGALPSSELHNVLSGPLGLSDKKSSAIYTKSLLKRPKANVMITIETQANQNLPIDSMTSFSLDWDVPFVNTELLMNRVQSKFFDQDPLMLDLVSTKRAFDIKTSSSLFQSLPSSYASMHDRLLDSDSFLENLSPGSSPKTSLNASISSDGNLLAELQMIDDVISKLEKNKNDIQSKTPDLFSFTLTGLKSIGDEHGVGSDKYKEAEQLVSKHLNQITDNLKSIYKGNVMIEVLTMPSSNKPLIRKTRSLKGIVPNVQYKDLNLQVDYYPDYPVTFNIVLWLMVILVVAVFFIAYGIWNMNPNLESILYRVPQDETKKTN